MDEFNRIAAKFATVADFLLVYTEESHPVDGWFVSACQYAIKQHKCVKDRIDAASIIQKMNPFYPVVVDTIDNEAVFEYGAPFERLFILKDEIVSYEGGMGPMGYKLEEVEAWLTKNNRVLVKG